MKIRLEDDLEEKVEKGRRKLRYLELPANVDFLEDEELVLKGESEDEVVLCNGKETFRVRQIHTSNLSLLIELETGLIKAMDNNWLEVSKTPPRLEHLVRALEAYPYEGPEDSIEMSPVAIEQLDCQKLFGRIQASDEEIRRALSELGATLIDGCYRILGADYQCRFFRYLFSSLALLDLRADQVIPLEVIEGAFSTESDEFPLNLLHHLLEIYGGIRKKDEQSIIKFDENKICRFFGKELLKAKQVWVLTDLLSAWKKLTFDLLPTVDHLKGLALLELIPGDSDLRVTYFPSSALPMDPIGRFQKLFEASPKWDHELFEPYIEESAKALGLCTTDLIVKFARISIDPTSQKRVITSLLPTM